MEGAKEEVKDKPVEGEVDEKGVPVTNRIKEAERKIKEEYERKMDQMRQDYESRLPRKEEARQDPEAARMARLQEFVTDPDAFIENRLNQRNFQAEIPEALTWLKGRPGYSAEDEARIGQIIKEHKLDTPYHNPMLRVKTAWDILEAEKLRKEFDDKTDETKRENAVSKNVTEGAGRKVDKKTTLTRKEILDKLGEASRKGDFEREIFYTNMLEDVRE